MIKTIENLRRRPESYRRKVAFFTAAALSLVIFVGWAGSKGVIKVPRDNTVSYGSITESESNDFVDVENAPSPINNTGKAFKMGLYEIKKEYLSFKNSIANVLAPFFSGIEVYESK